MSSTKYELPPVPPRESPIPVSEVRREDAGGLDGGWLDRRAHRGDGPPCFRPPGSKRRMTYPAWVRMWARGEWPSAPPTLSIKRPQDARNRELGPA